MNLQEKLPDCSAAKQTLEDRRRLVQAFTNSVNRMELPAIDGLTNFTQCRRIVRYMVSDKKTLYAQTVDRNQIEVSRAKIDAIACIVAIDRTENHNSTTNAHQRNCRVVKRTPDTIEKHIDTVGTSARKRRFDFPRAMIYCGVSTEIFHNETAFLFSAGNTHNPASHCLGHLNGKGADATRCAGDDHRFSRQSPCRLVQCKVSSQPRPTQDGLAETKRATQWRQFFKRGRWNRRQFRPVHFAGHVITRAEGWMPGLNDHP